MHVKYASRHALYPVPNVFDAAAVVVAARADVFAMRDTVGFAVALRADGLSALRPVIVVRGTVVCKTVDVRVVRAGCFVRVTARDPDDAFRETTPPDRAVVVAARVGALCVWDNVD